jgi:hypothetical protein
MRTMWRKALGGILALGIFTVLLVGYGCGSGNDIHTNIDVTPDAFSFTAQTGVPLNTVVTSNTVTVSGINVPVEIIVTNGKYSINGGTFTSTPGTVTNGQTVTVQQTSASTNGSTTTATVVIAGISKPFDVTTL